eukprot:5919822-Prymnesium_polylepis.2
MNRMYGCGASNHGKGSRRRTVSASTHSTSTPSCTRSASATSAIALKPVCEKVAANTGDACDS